MRISQIYNSALSTLHRNIFKTMVNCKEMSIKYLLKLRQIIVKLTYGYKTIKEITKIQAELQRHKTLKILQSTDLMNPYLIHNTCMQHMHTFYTYMHTQMDISIHTLYSYICKHRCTLSYILSNIHTYMYTYIHTCIHT